MAISMDLRKRAIAAHENGGGSIIDVAARFGVASASLVRWIRLKKETGGLVPRPFRGGRRSRIKDDAVIRTLVEQTPDATLAALVDAYAEEAGVRVSNSAMTRALQRLAITRKKDVPRHGTRNRACPAPEGRALGHPR